MPKRSYYGVANTARRIKKIYIGVDGVARKVRKAYIGVNGVARPFFTGGEVKYYGSITPLPYNASIGWPTAATDIANTYGIFVGGEIIPFKGEPNVYNDKCRSDAVAYSRNFTQIIPAKLPEPRASLMAVSVADYAIFAGGYYIDILTNDTGIDGSVDIHSRFNAWAYNKALTCVTLPDIPEVDHPFIADVGNASYPTVSIADHAIIARQDGQSVIYDKSLTQSLLGTFNIPIAQCGDFAKAGNLAILGSCYFNGKASTAVYALDENLTQYNAYEGFSEARISYGAASNLLHAIFVGGSTYNYYTDAYGEHWSRKYNQTYNVDAYDGSLTKVKAGDMLYPCAGIASATLGDCAVFAGIRGNEYEDRPWDASSGARYIVKYDSELTCTHVVGDNAYMNNPHKSGVSVCFADKMLIVGSADYSEAELTDAAFENYASTYTDTRKEVDVIILD